MLCMDAYRGRAVKKMSKKGKEGRYNCHKQGKAF